jgi:uncharacterized protein YecE (DUF72 family)
MDTPGKIWIGMGGWEHEVMNECFYGTPGGTSAERLAAFSRSFDLVEVRPTFWDDTLDASDASRWADAVVENRRFLFSVKLHSSFTHRREVSSRAGRSLRAVLQELVSRNRLAAALAQFPYAFTNTSANRYHLSRIAEQFRGFPLHAEFRHASWHVAALHDILGELGMYAVSGDMPRIRLLMPYLSSMHGGMAYLRLHGRNERGWLVNALDSRYDYLYNGKEILELRRRTESAAGPERRVLVVFNNTTGGKAIANAFQFASALRGGKQVEVPQPTLRAFPFLETIAAHRAETLFADAAYRVAM